MSGRSGRRRESQKPGTACGAASTAGRGDSRLWFAAVLNWLTVSYGMAASAMLAEFHGLIDHPARDARAVFTAFGQPCRSEIAFQILGGFLRRPFQVERRYEMAVAIHQIDQRRMVH